MPPKFIDDKIKPDFARSGLPRRSLPAYTMAYAMAGRQSPSLTLQLFNLSTFHYLSPIFQAYETQTLLDIYRHRVRDAFLGIVVHLVQDGQCTFPAGDHCPVAADHLLIFPLALFEGHRHPAAATPSGPRSDRPAHPLQSFSLFRRSLIIQNQSII